jgi:hypothetical protein
MRRTYQARREWGNSLQGVDFSKVLLPAFVDKTAKTPKSGVEVKSEPANREAIHA